MKLVLLFSVVLILGLAYGTEEEDKKAWEEFKKKFEKVYKTPEEEAERLKIFLENKKRVEEHNKKYEKGETSYSLGINQFADMTHEEWKKNSLGLVPLSEDQLKAIHETP